MPYKKTVLPENVSIEFIANYIPKIINYFIDVQAIRYRAKFTNK